VANLKSSHFETTEEIAISCVMAVRKDYFYIFQIITFKFEK